MKINVIIYPKESRSSTGVTIIKKGVIKIKSNTRLQTLVDLGIVEKLFPDIVPPFLTDLYNIQSNNKLRTASQF